mgnify:CR=1 FL=1
MRPSQHPLVTRPPLPCTCGCTLLHAPQQAPHGVEDCADRQRHAAGGVEALQHAAAQRRRQCHDCRGSDRTCMQPSMRLLPKWYSSLAMLGQPQPQPPCTGLDAVSSRPARPKSASALSTAPPATASRYRKGGSARHPVPPPPPAPPSGCDAVSTTTTSASTPCVPRR